MPATGFARSSRSVVLWCLLIGVIAGIFSGMFGVGGGTVVVPALVFLLGFDQRLAAGTSLAAIVPTSMVGVISFATHDSVAWVPALILAIAAVIGAQIGSWLLPKVPQRTLRWFFVVFLVFVVISLFVVVPSREASIDIDLITGAGLALLGLITGVLAGLLGVGGGVVVVPALMLFFGASDLLAKGTSLLMMIPTAVSGTIGNLRRGSVNLKVALLIGVAACCTTPLGAWLAALSDPLLANILFAAFLLVVAGQMAVRALRHPGSGKAR